ncbi:hypothetical protein [Mycolicibacterium goodii]|uniref:hypothetical protein n=1 Tax=Mycolicibacterium goodii TaxID=134601 RepID=UPI001BDBE401|nr:hypothetical protein [Mycolicibacterium goodii]MBU8841079.1 hypothetical protein [Mycolicibacterium goodii]
MLVTLIPVAYRDTNGIQLHGEIRLDGEITEYHREALAAALASGRDFVPGQLGLTHYGASESRDFPGPYDHGWHRLVLEDAVVVDELHRSWTGAGAPEYAGTITEFLGRIQAAAAAGWMPTLHAAA